MSTTAKGTFDDIPARERFELLATIREMREWRYSDNPPLRPLPPVQQSALALHQWLTRTCHKGADKTGQKVLSQPQGDLFT